MILKVEGLKKYFPSSKGRVVRAVDGISFEIAQGQGFGLIGESGCGKSTLAKCILRALNPDDGRVLFYLNGEEINLTALDPSQLRIIRPYISLIHQNPGSAMNPRMNVLEIISEPLLLNGFARGNTLKSRISELINLVSLDSEYMLRRPYSLSIGQKQRVAIARALALNPKLLIADEPMASLDFSMQAKISEVLDNLRRDQKISYLLISHNIFSIKYLCSRIAVMYGGKLVEIADREVLFSNPGHPYTQALLFSAKSLVPGAVKYPHLPGEAIDLASLPQGCRFHPRCSYAQDICQREEPVLRGSIKHLVACHFDL